jgi:hypothetical protein
MGWQYLESGYTEHPDQHGAEHGQLKAMSSYS